MNSRSNPKAGSATSVEAIPCVTSGSSPVGRKVGVMSMSQRGQPKITPPDIGASAPISSLSLDTPSSPLRSTASKKMASSGSPRSSPLSPKPPILVRTRFIIRGKVQGVYFRKFTQQKAVELGIFGEIHNEEDGSVRGEAEGRIEPMNEFKYWLQTKGSPKSMIESADFVDEAVTGVVSRKFSRFDIVK